MLAKAKHIDGHHFQFDVRGMHGEIDVASESPKGPNPKEYMLAALCACTGTDLVDLMKKFGVVYDSFELLARADLTEQHPKHFKQIDLIYFVRGETVDKTQVVEAAKRSMHQYSGTAAMLSKACPINYTVNVNGDVAAKDQASFEKY